MTTSAPLRCKCRRMAQTGLRCSRCFVPICPDCSKPAPVGILCRNCSRGKASHIYNVDPKSFAVAVPVCLLTAVFGGWLMATLRGLGFFGLFAGFALGSGIGELFLRLNQRKRGLSVEIAVGVCIFLGIIGGHAIQWSLASNGAPPIDPNTGETFNQQMLITLYLSNPWNWASLAVCCFGAVSRVKSV